MRNPYANTFTIAGLAPEVFRQLVARVVSHLAANSGLAVVPDAALQAVLPELATPAVLAAVRDAVGG